MFVNFFLVCFNVLFWVLYCFHITPPPPPPPPLSLVISKYMGIKYYFYVDDTQVCVHLSQKNLFAAFEQLNRCLDDVKEWVSTSKLKLNPDKTELIEFGLKRQSDKVKAYFPNTITGSPLCPTVSQEFRSMV